MNDILYEIFKKMPDAPLPAEVHQLAMRRVLFLKTRHAIILAASIASASFVFSLWHLYARMVEVDFLATARAVISTAEFDVGSMVDTLRSLSDIIPLNAAAVFLLNFIALGFILYLMRSLKRMERGYLSPFV